MPFQTHITYHYTHLANKTYYLIAFVFVIVLAVPVNYKSFTML